MQGKGRLPQLGQLACLAETGQLHEDIIDIRANLFIAGEQAEVGVERCGAGVIVAGSEMHIALEFRTLLANDHRHFCMRFMTDDAVHHVCTDLFELLREINVCLLIKTCQ